MANPYPYDKDGYCVHCRIAQYKPHKAACDYALAVDATLGVHVVVLAPKQTIKIHWQQSDGPTITQTLTGPPKE